VACCLPHPLQIKKRDIEKGQQTASFKLLRCIADP
jgi:hypothetical protein